MAGLYGAGSFPCRSTNVERRVRTDADLEEGWAVHTGHSSLDHCLHLEKSTVSHCNSSVK